MTGVAFLSVSPHYATDPHPVVKAAHPEGLIAYYGPTFAKAALAGCYHLSVKRGEHYEARYRAVHERVDKAAFPRGVVAEYEVTDADQLRVKEVTE